MATIADNTQTDFDNAEAIVIDMLQTSHPGISFRRGTPLRELLVRPVAEIYAADTRRLEDSMASRSLEVLKDSDTADVDAINSILSNFSTSLYAGRNANGHIFVQVVRDSVYSIPPETIFKASNDLEFKISRAYVVTSADIFGDEYIKLKQNEDGIWYFVLPVEAVEVGSKYELEPGMRFSVSPEFEGLVAATSYDKFRGGVDAQTPAEAIDELVSAVSLRGLGSRLSIKSTLMDKNSGNFAGIVSACSIVGYGDEEQIRDKSNLFGVSTGGKVDLFIRPFSTPTVITLEKTGRWDSAESVYVIDISHSEMPGYYSVKSVLDIDAVPVFSHAGSHGVLSGSSYPVSESFSVPIACGFHSFPNTKQGAAYTAFRDIRLKVIPSVLPQDSEEEAEFPETKQFSVSAYAYQTVADVQDYVDRDDIRSLRDDIVVRTAPICFVQISASVSVPKGHVEPNLHDMQDTVAKYVNGLNFVSRLTASEIVAVLNEFDISRVEMMFGTAYGFKMTGRIVNASGDQVFLPGPDLDIDACSDPKNLVTRNTVCFATSAEDIEIKIIDDKQ